MLSTDNRLNPLAKAPSFLGKPTNFLDPESSIGLSASSTFSISRSGIIRPEESSTSPLSEEGHIAEWDEYKRQCKHMGVVPAGMVESQIRTNSLQIPYYGLEERGARALGCLLNGTLELTFLDLSTNRLGDKGVYYLSLALKENKKMKIIHLKQNMIGPIGAKHLSDLIQDNHNIVYIDLEANRILDSGAVAISSALKVNKSLRALDLAKNEIGDMGMMAIGAAISKNNSLQELNLAWNIARPRGMSAFFAGLKDNAAIRHLNLKGNGIEGDVQLLGAFLAKNSSINVLNLCQTRLSDAALGPLIRGIENSPSLTDLDVSKNMLTDVTLIPLMKAVIGPGRIKVFSLQGITLTRELVHKLQEQLNSKPITIIHEQLIQKPNTSQIINGA